MEVVHRTSSEICTKTDNISPRSDLFTWRNHYFHGADIDTRLNLPTVKWICTFSPFPTRSS